MSLNQIVVNGGCLEVQLADSRLFFIKNMKNISEDHQKASYKNLTSKQKIINCENESVFTDLMHNSAFNTQ